MKKKSNSDANKQKEVTAASFKRVAKSLRARARMIIPGPTKNALEYVAYDMEAEATLLRSMR